MSFCMTMCLALLPLIFMFSCWSRDCGNSSSFFSSSSCCCWGGRICICWGGGAWAAAAAAAFCSNMWRSPVASTAAVAVRQERETLQITHTHCSSLSPHNPTHTQTHTPNTHHACAHTHTHTHTHSLSLSLVNKRPKFHTLALASTQTWMTTFAFSHTHSIWKYWDKKREASVQDKLTSQQSFQHTQCMSVLMCFTCARPRQPCVFIFIFFDGHKNNFLSPNTHPHLSPKQIKAQVGPTGRKPEGEKKKNY